LRFDAFSIINLNKVLPTVNILTFSREESIKGWIDGYNVKTDSNRRQSFCRLQHKATDSDKKMNGKRGNMIAKDNMRQLVAPMKKKRSISTILSGILEAASNCVY
jgi:hypothetical protein